jgi:xylulokinase
MLFLGYDIGSSAVKAALVDPETGGRVASVRSPAQDELPMEAPRPGWAEQPPERWWTHVKRATDRLRGTADVSLDRVAAVGLSYQMHGLVLLDADRNVLRPSILWCDSRAVDVGREAFEALGRGWCLRRLLNSPGNFTAAKLAWVQRNEPDVYARAAHACLPGDYVALRMTGTLRTTPTGLSEGTLWDVEREGLAVDLLDHFGLDPDLFPEVQPAFSVQGRLTDGAASVLGLPAGTPVAYRAGDQPNNAFSLGVVEPGAVAATGGTSGVVYAVGDEPRYDERSRVNTFLHVNHRPERPRYGTLMCVNGAGILNRWLRDHTTGAPAGEGRWSYEAMNEAAARAPVGAGGLVVLPYGNGAERTLENADPGASVHGLRFNEHGRPHLLRAAQEGIAFALCTGIDVMREMGLAVGRIRAGRGNLFQSPVFAEAVATTAGAAVEIVETGGAAGAARGAAVGAGRLTLEAAVDGLAPETTVRPHSERAEAYAAAYDRWQAALDRTLDRGPGRRA